MPRILFVCTGNMCRSPMAEGMMRTALVNRSDGEIPTIDSAGLHAPAGRPPAPYAVEVAATRGADIGRHRSRLFLLSDFGAFDCIIAMDRGHLDYLAVTRPDSFRGRIELLRDVRGRNVEVPDPMGSARGAYVRAADLIATGIRVLLAEGFT